MKTIALLVWSLGVPAVALGQQAAPDLFASANGSNKTTVYPGWPLMVQVTIMNSTRDEAGGSAPLTVSPQGQAWTNAIRFRVVSSSGQASQWPLTVVGSASDPALTLQPEGFVRATWQVSPDDVSSLPQGTYLLTPAMEVSNSGGWNGSVESRPIAITIGQEPALNARQQAQKSLLLAEYALNHNDIDSAVRTTQQLLLAQPDNPQAMIAAANVLEIAGYTGLAFMQASAALNVYYEANLTTTEAPSNLLLMHQRLWTEMVTPDALLATTTVAQHVAVPFSPAAQTVQLTVAVTGAQGAIEGGSVSFSISDVPGAVASAPVTTGSANVNVSIPGGTAAGTYAIRADYSGTSTFASSSDSSAALTILKATPTITWQNPADIQVGTALGLAQLNATANVPGAFVYSPPEGTRLPVGTGQLLSVTFTPSDVVDYNTVTATVSINVTALADATPPVVVPQTIGLLGNDGWYVGDVSVSWHVADPESAIASSSGCSATTLTTDTSGVTLTCTASNEAGVTTSASVTARIDKTAPVITPPANQTVPQTTQGGAVVSYPPPVTVETLSGLASTSCAPASGSIFAVGVTTVVCAAIDRAGNAGNGAFTVTVTATPTATTDGRMVGAGIVSQAGMHGHFLFRTAQVNSQDYGRFHFWSNDPRRCASDDEFDRTSGLPGASDADSWRIHRNPVNHFEATSVVVVFSDAPGFQPASGPLPAVDTVRLSGTGRWNGRPGYRFEATATDRGEPGRRRDTFALVIRDARGNVVANVSGLLDAGNIQSTRLLR